MGGWNTLLVCLICLPVPRADDCIVHDDVGRGVFLGIYFSSGAIGMLASLSTSVLRIRHYSLTMSTLGASGAICGIIASKCILNAGLVP